MSDPMVKITGDTYPVKDMLRLMGGVWDAAERCWRVPAQRADEAKALVDAVPSFVCDECGSALRHPYCPACRDENFIRQVGGVDTGWPR